MTDENPCTVGINAFLDTKFLDRKMLLELRFRNAV